MIRVILNGRFRSISGGERELELEASTIRQLFLALAERHPALEPHLDQGVAVAINGEIIQDGLFEPIPPDAEVHIMPMIVGG